MNLISRSVPGLEFPHTQTHPWIRARTGWHANLGHSGGKTGAIFIREKFDGESREEEIFQITVAKSVRRNKLPIPSDIFHFPVIPVRFLKSKIGYLATVLQSFSTKFHLFHGVRSRRCLNAINFFSMRKKIRDVLAAVLGSLGNLPFNYITAM